MLRSFLILSLFHWLNSLIITPRRQEIFDTVFTQMTKGTGCVDEEQFIKTLFHTLQQEMIIPEIWLSQKVIIDQILAKYKVEKKFYKIESHRREICIVQKQTPDLRIPKKDYSQLKITVKDTVDQYPYLKQNMNTKQITKLYYLLPKAIRQTCRFRRYTILNHQLRISYNDGGQYAKYIIPHLNQLPDMDFLMSDKQLLRNKQISVQARKNSKYFEQYIGKFQWYTRLLIQIPLFLQTKNLIDRLEFNKFILPGNQLLNKDDWNSRIKQVDEGKLAYKWEDKIQKAYYRPIVSGFAQEEGFYLWHNIPYYFTRLHLVNMSRHNQDLNLTDVQFNGLYDIVWLTDRIDFEFSKVQVYQLSNKDMQKYKYLISMDSWTASTRKAALILRSNSVLFKQMGEKVQWYFDKLVPNYHFISLNRTVDDIFDKVRYIKENDDLAK